VPGTSALAFSWLALRRVPAVMAAGSAEVMLGLAGAMVKVARAWPLLWSVLPGKEASTV
jgi:hypothetical protein